ncbi:MAG TPA: rhodanese-related sulfurtransferase [Candidatus Nanopelagicaceae bacterium]
MELQKVILYYGFTPLPDPEAIRLWQHKLAQELGLKGRILISGHGINGTLGGAMSDLKKYVSATKKYPGFKRIEFKWSQGTGDEFPRLKVKVKKELVDFGLPVDFHVNEEGVINGGTHLKPYAVNKLVEERGDEVLFFDGRNEYETKIGRFKNAIVPDVSHTRDFVSEIESGKYDHLKDRPIVTYCTGGIRCEILSTVMVKRGFKEVYQIDGGIVRYAQKYGDDALWQGSLYTFDGRMTIDFSDHTPVLGECEKCGSATNQFYNCGKISCHSLILLCNECALVNDNKACTHEFSRHGSEMVG